MCSMFQGFYFVRVAPRRDVWHALVMCVVRVRLVLCCCRGCARGDVRLGSIMLVGSVWRAMSAVRLARRLGRVTVWSVRRVITPMVVYVPVRAQSAECPSHKVAAVLAIALLASWPQHAACPASTLPCSPTTTSACPHAQLQPTQWPNNAPPAVRDAYNARPQPACSAPTITAYSRTSATATVT